MHLHVYMRLSVEYAFIRALHGHQPIRVIEIPLGQQNISEK